MDRKSACRSWIIPRLALRYTRSRATATATLGTFGRPREDAAMSQDTLDETFESTTPQEPDEPPPVALPPASAPKSERSKIKNKFSAALASPFKGSKGFHLGKKGKHEREGDSDGDAKSETKTSKRTKRGDDESTGDGAEEAEGGASGEEDREKGKKKKKSGARSRAGALVRRLGSLGGRRQEAAGSRVVSRRVSSAGSVGRRTPDGEDAPGSEPSVDDETGSRYDSVEDVVMPAPLADAETVSLQDDSLSPPLASPGAADAPEAPPEEPDPIATTHPVSTLPFAVSAWKPRHSKPSEIERPIESPSPEDTLRRRIAFVAQASACLSEDREDSPEADSPAEDGGVPAARLSRMVQLARLQRLSGERRSTSRSRSPSPGPGAPAASEPSPLPERTDDEDYEDTEDSPDGPSERGMPPFGNLIDAPDSKSDMGSAASSSQPIALGGDRREHLYKILVIGELGTGKTSIIKRYVHQFFSQHYRATIGVDFALKVLNWDNTTTVRLQLWDIAGQERFGNMTRVYYKEAVGAFVVFDVTRVATFEAVVKWKQDLDSKVQLPDGSPIPCVLLANKCDQQKEGIINTPAKMDEYCKERGFAGWFETSAKENINIEEAARALVTKILFNDKLVQSVDNRDNERFTLDTAADRSEPSSTTKSCAC